MSASEDNNGARRQGVTGPGTDMAHRLRNSGVLLVAANLVPLLGVLFLDWDLFLVLALFWLENVIIGVFGILKVAVATGGPLRGRVTSTLFFVLHYGVFMFAHGMLLISLFGETANVDGEIQNVPDLLSFLLRGDVGIAVLALLVSHGWSFLSNFRGGGENQRLHGKDAMTLPYRRVLITQAGLMLGGLAIEQLGTPVAGLIVLVVVKILVDLRFHRREHWRLAGPSSAGHGGAA